MSISSTPERALLPSRKEREANYRDRKEAFLVRAKLEAARMLARAEKRYHEAWLRSGQ